MAKKTHDDEPPTATTSKSWEAPGLTRRRPGRLTLNVIKGPSAGTEIVVSDARRIVVGRSRSADVVLDHPSISGAHFELRLDGKGIELRDLESTNGTWLGPNRVYHAAVGPGTAITAGECQLTLSSIGDVEVPMSGDDRLGEMFGRSASMREIFARIVKLARTPLDVLVTGETGTGKELAARALHAASSRAKGPWVVLDCGTQGRALIEAVLFGYRRGAFTGADSDRPGLVEAAHGGTLFIDEVGELPLDLQVRLLRALDRREVTRIGETHQRRVDIRVVAATNRDLVQMVAEGKFREDLFFRLAKARVELPPLRERDDDAVFLAEQFLEEVARERGAPLRLSDKARSTLASYRWPGNVRELRHAIERDAYMADHTEIDIEIMPTVGSKSLLDRLSELGYQEAHDELDRTYLARVMEKTNGKIQPAANMIGIDRGTLRSRLKELGLYSLS
ncbi:MAG: sigma 54-interacting transcriptional regulator [Nannocystaceae bacterium]